MYRLRTLGLVDLRDAGDREVTAVLVQPKRLALLVWLAASATDAFVRRDLLLPVFWPELSEARARNALRQAIHQLRRALGAEVVVSRGADALGIDGAQLRSDVHAFEQALARGALEDALAEYGGELLPGFGIDGAPAFERWLEDTRASLRHRATRAAWALAERRERAGDSAGAVEHARRAAALDADEEGAQVRLAALRERAAAAALPTPPGMPAIADARGTTPRGRVTVAPFQNLTGDPTLDFVGRLACDAIARGVLESRTVEVITADHADTAASAGLLVTGCYFLHDDAWRFEARIGAPGGRVLDTIDAVTAPRTRPLDAAEELRRRITGTLAGRLDPRFASWADAVAQAPDLDAHQELALGVERHLQGDYQTALPHFLRAAAARDGFTLPALWAVQACCNLHEWERAEAILAELTARSRRGRLSAFEQLGCDYYVACLDGRHGIALRIARAAAELVPDTEVLSQLGREAIFCNQPRAAIEALERLHPGRGWIPSWTPYWRRLTEAHHMLGEHGRELEAARRGRAHHPEAMSALLYEARALAALGEVDAVARCADEACTLRADRFADAGALLLEVARELRAHGHEAEGVALALRAVATYRDADGQHERRALARALYESERWADADAILCGLGTFDDPADEVDALGLGGAAAARVGDTGRARAALQALRARTGRFRFGAQHAWMARIFAVLGEPDVAISALHGAFARGYRHGMALHADVDLALLGTLPAFRELLRPKG